MNKVLKHITILLVILSFVFEWQFDRVVEKANKTPGLHVPADLPYLQKYLSVEMFEYIGDSSISVTVIHDVPLFYSISGITLYIDEKTFVVLIASRESEPRSDYTLLHEWGHVIQMYNGDLVDHGGHWTWEGELVDFRIPWGLRPWEIQADSIATHHQERLLPFRRFEPLR